MRDPARRGVTERIKGSRKRGRSIRRTGFLVLRPKVTLEGLLRKRDPGKMHQSNVNNNTTDERKSGEKEMAKWINL